MLPDTWEDEEPSSVGQRVRTRKLNDALAKKNKLPLPLPQGRWRVIWFGNLAQLPKAAGALGVYTFFILSGVPKDKRRIESVLISLAHMPLLHLGAEIDGATGKICAVKPTSKLTQRTLVLDLSPANTELITRSSLELQMLTAPLAKTPEYDSLLIRVKATSTAPEIYIPCSTLFLFFWAMSSSLVDAVTTEKLLSPERYLYNPDNTDLDSNPIRFEVRRQWSDEEAPYLVALLKEPNALAVGERVFKRIAGARMSNPTEPLPLEVWPPFARPLSLTGLFKSVGDALLLMHITSADLVSSWSVLELYREGGRRARISIRYENEPEETPPPSPPKSGSIGPAADIELQETPGGYSHGAADLPAVAALRNRFPALATVTVNKPIDNRDPVEQKTRKRRKLTPGPWSAINGRPLPNGKAIKGKIVGDEAHELVNEPEDDASEVQEPIDAQLTKFADLLARPMGRVAVGETEVDVKLDFWDPYRALSETVAPAFFELPKTVDREALTWLYRDPACLRTKRGLCVRVTTRNSSGSQQTRFIIDLERRIPRSRSGMQNASPISSGLMVVWFDDALGPLETCINLVLVLADAARVRSPALRIRPFHGVHIATIRHSDGALAPTLSNALMVTDQCINIRSSKGVTPVPATGRN